MLLKRQQHQKFVVQAPSAKRGWSGSIGMSLGSCIDRNSLLIGMSVSPNESPNRISARYLDFGLTGRQS